jgi:SMC interacting uncharacterized protein involved in chromosome segregation
MNSSIEKILKRVNSKRDISPHGQTNRVRAPLSGRTLVPAAQQDWDEPSDH